MKIRTWDRTTEGDFQILPTTLIQGDTVLLWLANLGSPLNCGARVEMSAEEARKLGQELLDIAARSEV